MHCVSMEVSVATSVCGDNRCLENYKGVQRYFMLMVQSVYSGLQLMVMLLELLVCEDFYALLGK